MKITTVKKHSSVQIGKLCILSASAFLAGCATEARINQFEKFAEAGTAYTQAVTKLSDTASKTVLEVDSANLAENRPDNKAAQGQVIMAANEQMRNRLLLLSKLARQTQLLDSYFVALSGLAKSDAPAQISTSTDGVVSALGKINQDVVNAKIGQSSVGDVAASVTAIVVRNIQRAELEKELKTRGPIIKEAIELQKKAFTLLAQDLETNLRESLERDIKNKVVLPYASEGKLPDDWVDTRVRVLSSTLDLEAVHAGSDVAEKLDKAFLALLEGHFTLVEYNSLVQEIGEILKVVQNTQTSPKS